MINSVFLVGWTFYDSSSGSISSNFKFTTPTQNYIVYCLYTEIRNFLLDSKRKKKVLESKNILLNGRKLIIKK